MINLLFDGSFKFRLTLSARSRPASPRLEQRSMGSKQKLWEDMAPTEKLAAIRELAEQLKALRDDRAMRHEPDEAQPIQLRPSACLRRGDAFLLSTAIALDHSAILTCRNIPLGASAAPPNVTRFFILAMKNPAGKG